MAEQAEDEFVERLLRKEKYVEGCPGCEVDKLKETHTGLPIKQVLIIWVIVLSTAMTIQSLFPFVYFMVRDFHIAKRVEDIGFYAGYIGCSYMLGRALTSVLWGIISDRYGRKPVIIIGCGATVIFNTLFGLSPTFWMAVMTRFLLGCFHGLLGPIKAYACELVRDEYQAFGLSAVSTAWGTGLIVGPALGGYLARPAEKFPGIIASDSIFARFPYFLPCLIISLISAVVGIACFWIPETLHTHPSTNISALRSYDALDSTFRGSYENLVAAKDPQKPISIASLLGNWPLMSSIIVYCVFSLHDMAYTEIFSMWAESPTNLGGLSYTTEDVGTVLSISGVGLLIFQSSVFPLVERIFGPILLSRMLGIGSIPLLTSYHYIAKLRGVVRSIVLNCASLVKNLFSDMELDIMKTVLANATVLHFCQISIVTGLFILQNRAVGQDQRGAANGIAMTLMSLFKAIGPAAGGALFSWGQKRQQAAFLPGDFMVFFILNIIEAIGVLMTFKPFLVPPTRTT